MIKLKKGIIITITKQVTFIAKDGCVEQLKALLEAMVGPLKAEDGVIFYDIFQLKDEPKRFIAVESWRDEVALDGHKASAYYAIYKSSYEPFCDEKFSNDLEILK